MAQAALFSTFIWCIPVSSQAISVTSLKSPALIDVFNCQVNTCPQNSQTNFVFPGIAMGLMGKSMFQVKLSGTSCSSEFRASVQETSFPV
jgi:hypothetical protein